MKRKKNIKMRGSKTHGYGSKKKHRGGGSKGGKGRAGTKKHHKIWLWKKGKRLGKYGFKSLRKRKIKPTIRAINLSDLMKLAAGKKEIDVSKLGFEKVLGKGKAEKSITIKAKSFSKKAEEKIKEAGSKAIKLGENNSD